MTGAVTGRPAAEAAGTAGRKAGPPRPRPHGLVPIVVTCAVLVLWEVVARAWAHASPLTAPSRLPAPTRVVSALAGGWSGYQVALLATLKGALLGLGLGIVVAALVSIASASSRWIEETIYPYLVASQMVPTIILAPIVLAVVKNGTVARVTVAAFISFFVIAINMTKGLRSVDPDQVVLLRSVRARRWQYYTKLRLPASLPFFFAGLKVAAPLAVVGEIVVELTGAQHGLGLLMLNSLDFGPSQVYSFWAAVLLTAALGYGLYLFVVVLERRLTPWQPEFRDR
jgi:NitT/TauT family transport system permease protein